MFSVENELLENLDTNNLLAIDNDNFEVQNLLKIYNLEEEGSLVNTIDAQYSIVTSFISKIYLENKDLPDDLKDFIKNSYNYRIYLLKDIETRMKDIITKTSVNIFKEIYILLNLLSNGKNYNLIDETNEFSTQKLQELLLDYEVQVCEEFLRNDEKSFELSFSFYLSLLELLNEVCIINSIDIQRRKNINAILELMTSSITNTKSKITLDKNRIDSLNAILGKMLLYFTNLTYLSIDSINKNIVIQKYVFMLEKIFDGYNLLNQDKNYYITFLEKIVTLVLTLIYKLKSKLHIENIKLSDSKELEDLFNLYNKHVNENEVIQSDNLNDFRDKLLLKYKLIHSSTKNSSLDENLDLIDYFISQEEISNVDMIILHNIVLYSDNISKEKLDNLFSSLLEKNKYDNDYFEYYKLKIIDRILQKYISLKIETSKNQYIEQIITYVEKNNLVSHLTGIYSKIYLSLSLYFSYEKLIVSQEKSKEFYFIYKRLDNNSYLEKEFHSINKQILFNYGKNYFQEFNFRTQVNFSNVQFIQIGQNLINSFIKQKDLEIENNSLLSIETLTKSILDMNEPNEKWLNKEIESLVIDKIFLGLVKAEIVNTEEEDKKVEVGFDFIELDLINDYKMKLYYSSFYKNAVIKLLESKKEFIQLVVQNILKNYLNNIPSYTDVVTKIPNINKLKNVLREKDQEEILFFEVYLNSLVEFSKSHNVKTSNEFFKVITDKISEELSPYRLFGPKIGFIVDESEDYKEIITYLEELKITYDGTAYDLDSTIGISRGKASSILDKSFYALSSAKLSESKVFIYQ